MRGIPVCIRTATGRGHGGVGEKRGYGGRGGEREGERARERRRTIEKGSAASLL